MVFFTFSFMVDIVLINTEHMPLLYWHGFIFAFVYPLSDLSDSHFGKILANILNFHPYIQTYKPRLNFYGYIGTSRILCSKSSLIQNNTFSLLCLKHLFGRKNFTNLKTSRRLEATNSSTEEGVSPSTTAFGLDIFTTLRRN